jgi:hypothetical protein
MTDKKDIAVPLELFSGDFDISKIGAICILLSTPHLSKESLDKWSKDDTLSKVILQMIKDETIQIHTDEQGNQTTIIHTEKKEIEKNNMTINGAISEIRKKYAFTDEDLKIFQEYMEEVGQSLYYQGYEDGRIDFGGRCFTAYGHSEDFTD